MCVGGGEGGVGGVGVEEGEVGSGEKLTEWERWTGCWAGRVAVLSWEEQEAGEEH